MSELSLTRPSLRVEAVTGSVLARPGTVVPCTVRVHNDGAQSLRFTVRVVGLGEPVEAQQVPWEPLAPGGVLDIEVPVIVPDAMAPGDHSVAIEVTVDNGRTGAGGAPVSTPGRRPMKPTIALAPMIVKVGSLDQVLLRTNPSVVKGRFGSRFELEVINKRHDAVTVDLAADAPDLEVEFEPSTVMVPSGESAIVAAKVRGSHHWLGSDRQHIVNIEGSGSAVPAYTRVVFRERPILARGLRGFVAAIVLLSLWAGVLGGAAFWLLRNDSKAAPAATAADLNGDGLPDKPGGDTGTGADGGTGTGADGGGDGAGGTPGTAPGTDPDAAAAPTSTVLRGKVKAGDTGDDGDVVVTLTPLVSSLDDPDGTAAATATTAAAGFLGRPAVERGSRSLLAIAVGAGANVGLVDDGQIATGGKFWSARYGTYTGSRLATGRATISVIAGSSPDGTWTIDDVPLRRSYEVSFSKPGFDRQSFLVTPTDDGKPVELDVVLVPGEGALGGVINGPAGRLGGVELTVTDGTLTFSATTSTDPTSLGEWFIDGLSTPATYTITAVLDGYGTAVAQVSLGVGESATDLAYTMTNGVGSIGGTVTGADGPLGGITLTASGNGVTRTTTSLTAGATGTYLFPDMEIPGVYTLSATAPGYITQTRLVTLTGNATGIDLNLVRTTARVIGVVTSVTSGSSGPGLPLPNASAEITLDNLSVRTTTAVAPDTGSFDLADLPPGTYTISFGRYDHLPDSRLITLAAGQVLDLGEVPLVYSPRPQLDPTGSISVSVSDVDGPLDEATITVTDVAGRLPVLSRTLATGETSFKFEQVPIGTYRIVVTRESYRPLTIPRVAIGLSDRVVTANLLKFGQAFGQVIDGVAPQVTVADQLTAGRPLNDYRMLVYEVLAPGVYACRGTVESGPGEPVDGAGRINWEVGLSLQLLSGSYVLRFARAAGDVDPRCSGAQAPRGYAARPDSGGNVGSFVILPDNDDPVKVDDVAVFPYPHIAGLVFAPVWNNGAVELQEATTLAGGLAVRLRCGGLVANATLSVASGVVTFDLSRQAVGAMFSNADVPAGGVLGNCRIEASAPGFASVDRAIPTALTVPTGTLYDDRVLSIVLADDPDDLVGTTTWVDRGPGGTVHVISGATISASDVIVSFDVTQAVDTNAEDGPAIVPGPDGGVLADLFAISAPGSGVWAFTVPGQQQLAGESTYAVAANQYDDASFTLRIDGTGRLLTAQSGLETPVVDDGTLDLQLQPTPGALSGTVSVVSSVADPPVEEALIHATPPGGTAVDVSVTPAGDYSIDPAAAGTWQVDFRADPDSNLVPAPGQSATTEFVDAGSAATVDPATYWDLAQVSVAFQDSAGSSVYDATVDVAQSPPAVSYPTWVDRADLAEPSGPVVIRRLSVDVIDPTIAPVSYQLTVAADGYDLSTGSYEVYEEGNPVPIATGGDPTSITVSVVAGSRLRVAVTLPANGSIAGTVRGLLRPPSVAPADVEVLDLNSELTISVLQVLDGKGNPVVPAKAYTVARVAPTGPNPTGFTVEVPPGEYDVTYSHPDFVSTTVHYVVADGADVDGSANLDIARGSFELAIVTDNVSLSPVADAVVKLFPSGTRIGNIATATPAYQGVTDVNGLIDFDPAFATPFAAGTGPGIIPGDYLLVVRKVDPLDNTRDDHFPVIATILVPRGGDAAARTLSRRAVMPRTDGSIVGTLTARNIDGDPLPMPAPVTISRTYAVPQAGGSDGVDNDATEDNLSPVPAAERTVSPTGPGLLQSSFGFQALGAGVHTLTFSDADGFATPEALDAVVDGVSATTVGPIEYVADYVDWDVTIVAGNQAVSGLTLTALGPNGDTITADEVGTSGVYRFTDVAPQIDPYVLQLNSDYYEAVTVGDLSVPVRPRSTTLTTTVDVKAVAVIEGVANKLGAGGATTPLTEANAITLRSALGAVLQTTTADASGNYRFTVQTAGTYTVRATVAGHTIENVTITGLALGTTQTAPVLNVEQFATATITVTGTPDGTATVTSTPSTGVTITEDSVLDGVFNVAGLDPGVTYVFNATAPGRVAGRAPATGSHDPDIGGTYAPTIALEQLRTFTGSVANDVDGATVLLFKNSVQAATTSTAGGGNYSFSGLDYGSYTVSISKGGVGAGATATAIVVAAGSATSVTVPEITLVPRQLDITFAVTFNTGTATATITLDGNSNAAGDMTFTVSEDDPLAYSIDAPGYLRRTGTLTVSPTATTPLTLTPAVTLTRNSLSGTVIGFSGNASVRLCPGTPASACANPSRAITGSAPGYTFNAVAPGTYTVFAIKGSVTVSTTVVVNDDGTVGTVATLDLTPPPPP